MRAPALVMLPRTEPLLMRSAAWDPALGDQGAREYNACIQLSPQGRDV